jgi:DNA polymerase-1
MRDEPVRPASEGTFTYGHAARFTAGAEFVKDALVEMMRRNPNFAVDIETYGLGQDSRRLKSVCFAHTDHAVVLDPRDPVQAHLAKMAFKNAKSLTFHSSTFDVPALHAAGLMSMEDVSKVWDTLIWARLADPGEHGGNGLEACAVRMLGATKTNALTETFRAYGFTKSAGFHAFDLDRPVYLAGAVSDGLVTAALRPAVRARAVRTTTRDHPFRRWGVEGDEAERLVDREQAINRMLLRRACKGLRVDFDFLDDYRARTAITVAEAAAALEHAGIRPGVGADLAKVLEELGEMPEDHPRTPKTGAYKMTAKLVEQISHPLAKQFVEHKQIVKVLNDYLVKVRDLADSDGRIHPVCSMLAAVTGRSSMSDPPLQQFPGGARGIILADEGDTLVSIDWSQIEPVVMANIAGEQKVLEGYENGTSDVYTDVAILAGGIDRKTAKVVLLAQMYGEGIKKLAADLGISQDEAKDLKAGIFRAMPRARDLMQKWRNIGEEHQKIFTLSGRIVPIPMGEWDGRWSVQTHKAINFACQGSAYDVLAETLVAVEEAGLGDAVYMGVHDEVICSQAAAHDIQKIMETPPARLCELAGRTPILRTDLAILGDRWGSG